MGFREPAGGGRGRGVAAGETARGVAAILLLTLAACGRSELGEDEFLEAGGATGRAGGASTSGRAGGSGNGASGSNGVAGGANSSGAGGNFGSSGANGLAGGGNAGGQFGSSGASGNGAAGNGAAGNGAAGSGASGGGGAFENCANGIDDDHDGSVDCADADCVVGFTCAPSTPGGGWVGPLAVWQGSGTPPSCASANGFPKEVTNAMSGIGTAASTCPSCSCGAPQGVSCQVGTAALFRNDTCSGSSGTLTVAESNCVAFVSLSYDPASVRWDSAPAAGGACVPKTSGSAVHPPIQWDTQIRACGEPVANSGGCGAGTCVPRQKMPFGQAMCIYQRSDLACPAGPYSVKSIYFTSANDTRTCSACDCSSPTGTTCTGNMKLYTDLSCSVDETTLSSVFDCSPLTPDPTPPSLPYMSLRSMRYTGTANPGGTCPVQPSTVHGSTIPEEPITLCCTP